MNQLLRFAWSYDTSAPDLAGYTVYQNGIPIADIHDPTALEIDQEVILESGTNSFTMTAFDGTGNESPHSAPYVLEVPPEDASGNIPPLARIQPSATLGEASFFVDFDAAGSLDYDGAVVGYYWDFGDGYGAEGGIVGHTFDRAGVYRVTLTVNDNEGATSAAETTITVTDPFEAPNDLPVAHSAVLTTNEDNAVSGLLSATAAANDIMRYAIVTNGQKGRAVIMHAATGNFFYIPAANATGTDSFSFKVNDGRSDSNVATVTVVINAVNDLPAARHDIAATSENTAVLIPVLANDTDADGESLAVSGVGQAAFGTVSTDGADISYAPRSGWSGTDTFIYMVSDGRGGTDTATVSVTVTARNDLPVAHGAVLTTNEDTAVSGLLSATDAENDLVRYSIVTNGQKGRVIIMNAATGNFFYIPAANATGTDSFSFRVNDGRSNSNVATVTVVINAVNDLPAARHDIAATSENTAVLIPVLANDTDADGESLAVSGVGQAAFGTVSTDGVDISYTPRSGWSGTDTFFYTVSDGRGGKATATVNVNVSRML